MEKYCPNCRSIIKDPGTSDMFRYAKFWRDNKCYICESTLIIKNDRQQNTTATIPREPTMQTSTKKKIKWGWIVFSAIVILVIYFISTMKDLNVNVQTLKNGDSSVLWITNNENVPIKLLEVEINSDYTLDSFPDSTDTYMKEYLIGRGQKYIQPNEKIMLFTKYFHDKNGKIFDSYNIVFTKIKVSAEVGSDFRMFVGKP